MFPLEHFYYGQLVHHGSPQTDMRVLAKSTGIRDEQIAEAIRFALIAPSETIAEGSWALVRGRRTPFFMVQSQKGTVGQMIVHFIVMPPDTLRNLTGNIKVLSSLVQDNLPTYNQLGDDLVPLTLAKPEAMTASAQADDLLDLMTFSKNKMPTIESLLSAVVKGITLVIINAPNILEQRAKFIQGLLTLLPSSTRYGVTFATASDSKTQTNLQIRFQDSGKAPGGSIVYDWSTGLLEGDILKDDYSHFIVSQFRLDAELVIQQTDALTPIAGWRFRSGDSLASALSYASYRIKIDNAVQNNQPVETADVSKVLADDPTLTADLRVSYSRHLINLSLALENMEHAAPVAVMLHQASPLSQDIHKQMSDALNNGLAYLIYETLLNWMSHPLGPQGQEWIDLTYRAALAFLDELIEDEAFDEIHEYIESIQSAATGVAIGRVIPRIIDRLLPLVDKDETLAMPLLSLSIQHVPKENLAPILNNAVLRNRMPQTILAFLAHLFNQVMPPAPQGTLMGAVDSLSPKSQKGALIKFTTMAQDIKRIDLIDSEVLKGLFDSTQGTQVVENTAFLLEVVKTLIEGDIKHLQAPGPRYLLQILYALHQYDLLAQSMISLSRDYYGIDRQFDYVEMVQLLFASVNISPNEATTALVAIRSKGIKGLPYLTASVGILEGSAWSDSLNQIAEEAIIMLGQNERFLEVIQPATILAVLEFYARHHNVDKMIEVGRFVPLVAANREDAALAMMRRMMKLMSRDRKARSMSFEYLRQYIRKSDDSIARKSIKHFGHEMKKESRHRLELAFIMSRFLGGVDLVEYNDMLDEAIGLLQDTVEAYHNNQPTSKQLIQALDEIRVGFDVDERDLMVKTLIGMGRAIILLTDQRKSNSAARRSTGLLSGSDSPSSIVDVFNTVSGVIGRNKRYSLSLNKADEESPFKKRSGPDILDQADIVNNLLRAPMVALPLNKSIKFSSLEIADEIESQLKLIPADVLEVIRPSLAENLQKLVELLEIIGEKGDARALEDGSALATRLDKGQRPRSTLEFYRFVHGYFH